MRTIEDFVNDLPRVEDIKIKFYADNILFDSADEVATYCSLKIKKFTGEIKDFFYGCASCDTGEKYFIVIKNNDKIEVVE